MTPFLLTLVLLATTELGLRDLLVLCGVEEGTVVIAESNGSETRELDEYGRRSPRIRPDRKEDVVDTEPHPNRPVLSWFRSWFTTDGKWTRFFQAIGFAFVAASVFALIQQFRPLLVELGKASGALVRWVAGMFGSLAGSAVKPAWQKFKRLMIRKE